MDNYKEKRGFTRIRPAYMLQRIIFDFYPLHFKRDTIAPLHELSQSIDQSITTISHTEAFNWWMNKLTSCRPNF